MLKTLWAAILAASITPSSIAAAEPEQNSQSVERRYCTQFGPFIFRFDPEKAAGIFAILPNGDLGSVVGTIEGHHLNGEWIEVDSRGKIRINFANDWSSFDAEYNVASNPETWHDGWIGVLAPNANTQKFSENDMTFYCN